MWSAVQGPRPSHRRILRVWSEAAGFDKAKRGLVRQWALSRGQLRNMAVEGAAGGLGGGIGGQEEESPGAGDCNTAEGLMAQEIVPLCIVCIARLVCADVLSRPPRYHPCSPYIAPFVCNELPSGPPRYLPCSLCITGLMILYP